MRSAAGVLAPPALQQLNRIIQNSDKSARIVHFSDKTLGESYKIPTSNLVLKHESHTISTRTFPPLIMGSWLTESGWQISKS